MGEDERNGDKSPVTGHQRTYSGESAELLDEYTSRNYSPEMPVKNEIPHRRAESFAENHARARSLSDPQREITRNIRHIDNNARTTANVPPEELVHVPECLREGFPIELLQSGPTEPFLTTETLQELDLYKFKHNPALRVDIHHDLDLHFTPISGKRGEEKRAEKEKYFSCLEYELLICQHRATCAACIHGGRKQPVAFGSRIRLLFSTLKDLLLLLVPDDDHHVIDESLNVSLLVQEVQKGVLDVGSLSNWLKALLTSHCAPIRDERACEMATIMAEAADKGDMHQLVVGLEKLFLFLECMRLDVANHHIRTFRAQLIQEGVFFQREHFLRRIDQGRLNVDGSQQWYRQTCSSFIGTNTSNCSGSSPTMVNGRDILVHGIVDLCCSGNSSLPVTFKHDSSRIRAIQRDLQTTIHLECCYDVYRQIVHKLTSNSQSAPLLPSARLLALLEPDTDDTGTTTSHYRRADQTSSLWLENAMSLAIEVTQQAHRIIGIQAADIPSERFTMIAKVLQDGFEQLPQNHAIASQLSQRLRNRVLYWTKQFHTMTPLDISESQRRWQRRKEVAGSANTLFASDDSSSSSGELDKHLAPPDLEDIARKLAHMAVLHWQVWRDLAYLDWELCAEFGIDSEGIVLEDGRLFADGEESGLASSSRTGDTVDDADSAGCSEGSIFGPLL